MTIVRNVGKKIPQYIFERGAKWRDDHAAAMKKALTDVEVVGSLSACPVCGSDNTRHHVEVYGVTYLECLNCRHVFCEPVFSNESLAKVYRNYNTYIPHEDKDLFRARAESMASPKVDFVSSSVNPKGLWVDVGCGPGEILYVAQSRGWSVYGIEPSEVAWKNCVDNGIPAINEYITPDNIGTYVKDAAVVSFFSIIEHVNAPESILDAVAKNMVTGGHLVLEVPRTPSLSAFSIMCNPSIVARHIAPPYHLRIYSEKSLCLTLNKFGFAPKAFWTFGQDSFELFSSLVYAQKDFTLDYWEELLPAAESIQSALDSAGLSDSMLVISEKL